MASILSRPQCDNTHPAFANMLYKCQNYHSHVVTVVWINAANRNEIKQWKLLHQVVWFRNNNNNNNHKSNM